MGVQRDQTVKLDNERDTRGFPAPAGLRPHRPTGVRPVRRYHLLSGRARRHEMGSQQRCRDGVQVDLRFDAVRLPPVACWVRSTPGSTRRWILSCRGDSNSARGRSVARGICSRRPPTTPAGAGRSAALSASSSTSRERLPGAGPRRSPTTPSMFTARTVSPRPARLFSIDSLPASSVSSRAPTRFDSTPSPSSFSASETDRPALSRARLSAPGRARRRSPERATPVSRAPRPRARRR